MTSWLAKHSLVFAWASSTVLHMVICLPSAQKHAQSAQVEDAKKSKKQPLKDFITLVMASTYF